MTESRSNQIQREKMTALLKAELGFKRRGPEPQVVDLRELFPKRDDCDRVEQSL